MYILLFSLLFLSFSVCIPSAGAFLSIWKMRVFLFFLCGFCHACVYMRDSNLSWILILAIARLSSLTCEKFCFKISITLWVYHNFFIFTVDLEIIVLMRREEEENGIGVSLFRGPSLKSTIKYWGHLSNKLLWFPAVCINWWLYLSSIDDNNCPINEGEGKEKRVRR